MTSPDFEKGQTGFMFERGILKMMLLDGKEIQVKPPENMQTRAFSSLWPEITEEDIIEGEKKYSIGWSGRFSLWYLNPNIAAMLLVEVLLVVLAAICLKKRRVFLLLLVPVAIVCLVCLIKTGSRGGIMALMAGLACFAVCRGRAFLTWKRIAVALVLMFAVGAFVFLCGYAERFTVGMFHEGYDQLSRLPIWKETPRMMMASSDGWGIGSSGEAYMNWFQPLDRFHSIARLVNSHLTFLVEFGWPMRCLYIMVWATGLCLLLVNALKGKSVLPFALWSAFFVGSIFNSLAHEWSLWLIPVATLSIYLRGRPWEYKRGVVLSLCAGAVLTTMAAGCFVYLGKQSPSAIFIRGNDRNVVVNGENTVTWVVNDGFVLDGGYHGVLGKDVRSWFGRHPEAAPVGFACSVDDVPADAKKLVLAGKAAEKFVADWENTLERLGDVAEIVLISPSCGTEEIPEGLLGKCDVKVIIGALALRMTNGTRDLPEWVKVVPGCMTYITGWMRYVTE